MTADKGFSEAASPFFASLASTTKKRSVRDVLFQYGMSVRHFSTGEKYLDLSYQG